VTAALLAAFSIGGVRPGFGQDLAPRAYVIVPTGSNAVTAAYSFNTGSVFVDPSLPVEDTSVHFSTQTLAYFRSLDAWGRTSNMTLLVPYVVANAQGVVAGEFAKIHRSGLADSRLRFSVNLWGGPAMSPKEFAAWQEKGLLGFSLTVVAPSGQYDPARIVNNGANRWGFKPEIGASRRFRRWVAEGYVGGWFYTPNDFYYPGGNARTQAPFLAVEAHLNYYVTRRLWVSLDGNFWNGGRTAINGVEGSDRQRNSRAGMTVALPVSQHQTLKFSYSRGTYVTIGGDYRTVSVAWQYQWLDRRE
jgi:hypothetical protein